MVWVKRNQNISKPFRFPKRTLHKIAGIIGCIIPICTLKVPKEPGLMMFSSCGCPVHPPNWHFSDPRLSSQISRTRTGDSWMSSGTWQMLGKRRFWDTSRARKSRTHWSDEKATGSVISHIWTSPNTLIVFPPTTQLSSHWNLLKMSSNRCKTTTPRLKNHVKKCHRPPWGPTTPAKIPRLRDVTQPGSTSRHPGR